MRWGKSKALKDIKATVAAYSWEAGNWELFGQGASASECISLYIRTLLSMSLQIYMCVSVRTGVAICVARWAQCCWPDAVMTIASMSSLHSRMRVCVRTHVYLCGYVCIYWACKKIILRYKLCVEWAKPKSECIFVEYFFSDFVFFSDFIFFEKHEVMRTVLC